MRVVNNITPPIVSMVQLNQGDVFFSGNAFFLVTDQRSSASPVEIKCVKLCSGVMYIFNGEDKVTPVQAEVIVTSKG